MPKTDGGKMTADAAPFKAETLILGGGAAGLFCALRLSGTALLLEKGPRVGRKLSATGNGQGNLTNENMSPEAYFPAKNRPFVRDCLQKFGKRELLSFFTDAGAIFVADEKGRVYPSGRQASALTDLLRYSLDASKKTVVTDCRVMSLQKSGGGFAARCMVGGEERIFYGKNAVICTGGKAAANFGTNGDGYALARAFGHTVTPLYPSLVQLKTDTKYTKTLKGKRVHCRISFPGAKPGKVSFVGDVIFTDYGISGDAVFRLSAFITDGVKGDTTVVLDFLPNVDIEELRKVLERKKASGKIPDGELFCGILDNQVGRAVLRRARETDADAAFLAKHFTLGVTGSLGYDYAQVTKGGVDLSEVDENMQSRLVKGLYFAGEVLDVDGECGGYNLQWAFTSAAIAAGSINNAR